MNSFAVSVLHAATRLTGTRERPVSGHSRHPFNVFEGGRPRKTHHPLAPFFSNISPSDTRTRDWTVTTFLRTHPACSDGCRRVVHSGCVLYAGALS
jgi:hypothetical protein